MKHKMTTFNFTNIIKGKSEEMDIEISEEQISRLASKLEEATFEFINNEAKEVVWSESLNIKEK